MLVGISHIWRLGDSLSIRDTLPRLDLLAGDGGGLPRHQLTVRLDGRYARWGVNAVLNWRGPARIRRDFGSNGPDDLRMLGLLTAGLRISTMIDAAGATEEGARRRHDGLRLEFEVENLFDSRPEARLGDGRPAPGYGRNAQDPLGRTLRLTLSRRF